MGHSNGLQTFVFVQESSQGQDQAFKRVLEVISEYLRGDMNMYIHVYMGRGTYVLYVYTTTTTITHTLFKKRYADLCI